MSGGGTTRTPGPGPGRNSGPSDQCLDRYEAELKDWVHAPGAHLVPNLRNPSRVFLQPDKNDKTIQVFANGTKIGHLVQTRLWQCMTIHGYDYDGVFIRKGQHPWVQAVKKP